VETPECPALGASLQHAGLRIGDRVATLMWNHSTYLEAYFGIPAVGSVVTRSTSGCIRMIWSLSADRPAFMLPRERMLDPSSIPTRAR
jgi:hypothetical protein